MDFFKLKVLLPGYPRPSPGFAELVVVQHPLAKPTEGTFLDDAVCGRYIAFMFKFKEVFYLIFFQIK